MRPATILGDWESQGTGWILTRGGDIAAQFAEADLIDEMIVSYAPCSLGSGAGVLPMRSEWALAESGVNGDFLCGRWLRGAGPSTL